MKTLSALGLRFCLWMTVLASTMIAALPAAATPFIGEIRCFGFNFPPSGWALLNGQLLSIADNTALFALIGTTYGGDGVSTFAVPDMRGRMMVHQGTGAGLSNYTMGQLSGQENTTLAVSNLPPHTHLATPIGSNNDASAISPAGKVPAAKNLSKLTTDPLNLVSMAASNTSATGGNQPLNNQAPTLTANCAISLFGIFPSQN
ncbi:tail fiber protein [Undibacterium sp. Jales W-56]|uniref:phage tail protein n=1 Tax=Undibacterium sp. Jales W-56 TaxID=2897325 RepID=UPI0021D1A3F1|nr:tail fiber protein [Undibacterium sp. Jales W-56]MCU6432967.1 tail fiber protein [Undibacterium sp. Jales W-56]